MSDSDWERQRVFLAVLDHGSLSAAARELGLAQPTVRRRIEELETDFGTALFTRSPSGLQPTEMALSLREHAEAMALAADAFIRTASAAAGEVAGTVRISASEVIAIEVLPPILAELGRRHPAIAIELSPSNRNEDLLRREADIAVRMVRPEQGALVARHVGAATLGLHAHRRYLEARGVPETPEDIVGHAFIGPDRDNAVLRAIRASGFPVGREQFTFRVDSDLAQLAAIRAGLGIGVCQVPLARRDPDLVRLLSDAFAFDLHTWVAMHEDLRNVARVRAVFDALVDGLSEYMKPPPQRMAPPHWPAGADM